jgi:hypothetical protein
MSLTRSQQARYRPLVQSAWLDHCRLAGTDPNNRQQYEDWYRDKLWSSCRIRSSSQAAPVDFPRLIRTFSVISRAGDSVELRGLTDAQNSVFSDLVAKAWQAACTRGATLTFCAWFDAELAACQVVGRRVSDRVQQFDEIMGHFAVIAGDEFWIGRTSEASERRLRHLIKAALMKLGQIEGRAFTWDYCRAIYSHMHMPLTLEEADARWLWKILQALDSHLRRRIRVASDASS